MGADWPNEAEEPSEKNANPSDSQTSGRQAVPAETRSREEYYADQHEAVSAQKSATARQDAADEQAAAEKWDKSAEEFRWMWGEYQRRWPPDERPPVDNSADPPGSWRADGDRYLDRPPTNELMRRATVLLDREREI